METEAEIVKLLKGLRIRIFDDWEYRISDKQAEKIAHELYIEQGEQ